MSVTRRTANEHSTASDECKDVDNNTMVKRRACLDNLHAHLLQKSSNNEKKKKIFWFLRATARKNPIIERRMKHAQSEHFFISFLLQCVLFCFYSFPSSHVCFVLNGNSISNQLARSASITFSFPFFFFLILFPRCLNCGLFRFRLANILNAIRFHMPKKNINVFILFFRLWKMYEII